MRRLGPSGVFDLFLSDIAEGEVYKFEILAEDGKTHLKADPMASYAEIPPATASRVFRSRYEWSDSEWMEARAGRDATRSPMTTYEVHLGSWKRDGDRVLTYGELATELVAHVKELGFNFIQLLPIAEHLMLGTRDFLSIDVSNPNCRRSVGRFRIEAG